MKLIASVALAIAILTLVIWETRAGMCIPPELEVALVKYNYPKAEVHQMSRAEFIAFKSSAKLRRGDAAWWFVRHDYPRARVVLFENGCRLDIGEVSRDNLPTMMGEQPT